MVYRRLIISILFAITWMFITSNLSLENFAVGYVLGFSTLTIVQGIFVHNYVERIPQQVIATLAYSGRLFFDIIVSSIDVAGRIISPSMPLKTGIIAVPIGGEPNDDVVAAMSAHGITVTPGTLVVDFDEAAETMYVHCLDIDEALEREYGGAQQFRVEKFHQILGRHSVGEEERNGND